MFNLSPIYRSLLQMLGPLHLQHDYNVANDTGSAVRADINNVLQAIATVNSGASAPGTTFAYQLWADTTSGLLKQRNAANTGWLVRGSLAETFVLSRSSNTILGVADFGRVINATAGFTQTFTAAATLADGWFVVYKNNSSSNVTLDPNASEQVDGATTLVLAPGESCIIWCNGTAFVTVGLTKINSLTADATPDGTADYVATYDASAGVLAKVLIHNLFKTINGLTEDTAPDANADFGLLYDASGSVAKKVIAGRLGVSTLGSEQATTSGTSIDITSIPSWVRRIILLPVGVSTNGSSNLQVQLGDSGGIENTGYSGAANSGATFANSSSGAVLVAVMAAAAVQHGIVIIQLENASTNTWSITGSMARSDIAQNGSFSSTKSLSAALTQVRFTTVNGTDAFDLGAINYVLEG